MKFGSEIITVCGIDLKTCMLFAFNVKERSSCDENNVRGLKAANPEANVLKVMRGR